MTPIGRGCSTPLIPLSQFDEARVAARRSLIDLKSVYGLSNLRDVVTTAGSGAVTNVVGSGEYSLTTTASGTDSAVLESAERGRYVAGYSAEAGIGVRVGATPAGSQVARWGYYDGQDGFGFGHDATGVFVFIRKGGADELIRQSAWNVDKMDGTGSSGVTLTPSSGHVYQIEFTYYGYGSADFYVILADTLQRQRKVLVHRFNRTGSLSVENPNLPIRAEIDNDGTAAAFSALFVGGRQFSIIGDYNPNRRITSERRLSLSGIGTTVLPVISFRRKAAYESVSAKFEGFDIITDADLLVELRLNATLTGASFATPTSHTATETSLEADASATAISGGELVYSALVDAGGSGSNSSGGLAVDNLGLDLPALQSLTLAARAISGTATASAVLRLREEW